MGTHLKKKKRQTYVLTCFYDRNRPFLAFRNKHIPILEQNTAIVHLVFLRFSSWDRFCVVELCTLGLD